MAAAAQVTGGPGHQRSYEPSIVPISSISSWRDARFNGVVAQRRSTAMTIATSCESVTVRVAP